jgi:hypothetical protein
LAGKTLVSTGEMAGKIAAACDARASDDTLIIGRTDAIAVEGFDAALDRAEAYLEAGADMLFVEAPQTLEQIQGVVSRFAGRAPLMANMVEGGKTPTLGANDLEALGFSFVIFPRRGGSRHRPHRARLLRQSLGRGLQRSLPGPHVRFRRAERPDRNAGSACGRQALRRRQRGMSIDPITLAVLKGRLEQIADEMDATLFRAAFNPIIAEAHDASHGIYDAVTGETLVQGKSGLPIFVGVMSFAVKAVIDKAAEAGGLADGDIYIFNDPHMTAARTCPTSGWCKPYFPRRPGCSATSPRSATGTTSAATCRATTTPPPPKASRRPAPPAGEALRQGRGAQDIVDILPRNSRLPLSLYGDLNGQINALELGEKRIHALVDEYGDDTVRRRAGRVEGPRRRR